MTLFLRVHKYKGENIRWSLKTSDEVEVVFSQLVWVRLQ